MINVLLALSFFSLNAFSVEKSFEKIELSINELINQKDFFSRIKDQFELDKNKKSVLAKPYEFLRKRQYSSCYNETNQLLKNKKKTGSFTQDLLGMMVTCYAAIPRRVRPSFKIEHDFFENKEVVSRLFRDLGHDLIREILAKNKPSYKNQILVDELLKNPSRLCFFSENKKFSQSILTQLSDSDRFYKLSYRGFPCGLDLTKIKAFSKLSYDQETYKNYLKKGRTYLVKRDPIQFSYLKKKISLREYAFFRKLNRVKSIAYLKDYKNVPDYALNRVTRNLFFRGKYKLILELKDQKPLPIETLSYVSKVLVAEGKGEQLLNITNDIKFKPSKWSEEILLMRGGVYLRKSSFEKAEKEFSTMLLNVADLRLSALYWYWLSLRKQKKWVQAKKISEPILRDYPFSYYGLLVAQEYEGKSFFKKYTNSYTSYRLTLESISRKDSERLAEYYKLGWVKAFTKTYEQLADQMNPKERAAFALVFYNLGELKKTIQILNHEWDLEPQLRAEPFVTISFNFMYSDSIIKEAERNKRIDASIIRAVIRQESAFHKDARSASGAKGLMQLMNPTAREVARQLRVRNFRPNVSLYKPDLNIKLGAKYMDRLVYANNGYLPYAFASYNAGPGKMNKWSRKREKIHQLKKGMDYRIDEDVSEFWIEELPWVETRFYAKALLRNMGIYLALTKQEDKFECFPFWSCGEKKK